MPPEACQDDSTVTVTTNGVDPASLELNITWLITLLLGVDTGLPCFDITVSGGTITFPCLP